VGLVLRLEFATLFVMVMHLYALLMAERMVFLRIVRNLDVGTRINATNVMIVANLKRLQSFEPEDVKKRNDFFEKLNTDKNFPAQVRKGMNGLMIDSFEKKALVRPKYGDLLYLACEDLVKLFPNSISAS
jgi:hypothetical protein